MAEPARLGGRVAASSNLVIPTTEHQQIEVGRDKAFWVFIAIILTPIIAAFLLFLYGESKEHRKERIIKEELWRRSCNEEVMKIKEVVENKVSKEKDMSDPLNW